MNCWRDEHARLERELSETITLDALTGPNGNSSALLTDDAGNACSWLIAQRKGGHRHSIDDVLTAWYALRTQPQAGRLLDMGAGIGTVGLLTLWGLPPAARLTCVEAQEISYRLLQANLDANGLRHRVDSMHGDLRDLALGRGFPLITGSPPYFPPDAGVVPRDSQKAHARFELRGDVGDYASAAAAHLEPDGCFALCFPTLRKQRALDGIRSAGLSIMTMMDVIPRESLAPLFTLYACRHAASHEAETVVETPLVVREKSGRLTAEMAAVRRVFGFSDGEAHGGHGE